MTRQATGMSPRIPGRDTRVEPRQLSADGRPPKSKTGAAKRRAPEPRRAGSRARAQSLPGRSRLILVIGGCRSGKSDFAAALGSALSRRPVMLATCEPRDDEMRARVAAHRGRRSKRWITVEEGFDLAACVARLDGVVVIDSIDIWAANLMMRGDSDRAIAAAADQLIAALRSRPAGVIIAVASEVGAGLVPTTALGRRFRDLMGGLNRRLAAEAGRVFAMTAGIAVELKGAAVSAEQAAAEVKT
jgi:adenosylcobinamide kinase/adenosylcobinamide-phosphate guanylyltransferase